jgi:hypothetical protein
VVVARDRAGGGRRTVGHFLRNPFDLGQPLQGGPGQYVPDVMQRHEELVDSVQARVVARVEENPW